MLFPTRRRSRGQTTTEYMLVTSVIAIAAMFMLTYISKPNGYPQQAAKKTATNFEKGLTNDGGLMKAD